MLSSKGKPSNFNLFGRSLILASLNINSLLAHIDGLKIFIDNSKIYPLAFNKTKLDSSIHDYVNGRNDGGVCIYLRSNRNYHIRDYFSDDQLECLAVEITRPHSRPFIISTWYRPPGSFFDIFHRFEKLVDKIDSEYKDFYLLGDLNCDVPALCYCAQTAKISAERCFKDGAY